MSVYEIAGLFAWLQVIVSNLELSPVEYAGIRSTYPRNLVTCQGDKRTTQQVKVHKKLNPDVTELVGKSST